MYSEFYKSLLDQAGGKWFDFEGLIRDIYVAILRPGDVAVDVGAHRGDHTFQMAQAIAPNGLVVAIEAAPPMLEEITRIGKQYYSNLLPLIDLRGIGLSDHSGKTTFFFAAEAPGLSGLHSRPGIVPGPLTEFEVNLTRFDEISGTLERPICFMKVDVEGGEYHSLRGAQDTLRNDRPVVVFEHHYESPGFFSYTTADLVELFRSLQYDLFDFFGNSYTELASWNAPMIGNFLALPENYSRREDIFDVVRNTLAGIGVRY
jgi:FkbM family methyltransferase